MNRVSEVNPRRYLRRTLSASDAASGGMSTPNINRRQSVSVAQEAPPALNSFSHRMSIANASRSRMSMLSIRQPPSMQVQPKVTKPTLSVRDQLNIIRRLRSGEYNNRMGFEQFEDEKRSSGSIRAPTEDSTVKMDESTSSKGSGKSDEIKIGDLTISEKEYPNLAKFFMEPETSETYAKNPDYIKACDKLIVGILFLRREIIAGASTIADRTFASLLPPNETISAHRGMARIMKIVQKHAAMTPNKVYELFEPPKASSDGTMEFPFEDQKDFVECIKEASILLDKMNTYLGKEEAPNYEGTMIKLDSLATRLEEKLKILDGRSAQATKLSDILKELCPSEFDTKCGDGDGSFLTDSSDSTYVTDTSMERVGDD